MAGFEPRTIALIIGCVSDLAIPVTPKRAIAATFITCPSIGPIADLAAGEIFQG